MREPTTQEIWEHEDRFSVANAVADVNISLIDYTETGWKVDIYYNLVEDGEVVDTVLLGGFLWLDTAEDEFHLNVNGQVY